MRRFLISLSGARPEILEHCPGESGRFEGTGGAVLTTSFLAAISMVFALNSALQVSVFLAVPAGVVWGLAIMSLDRWLVISIRADARGKLLLAVPRLLLALLLGATISTPLVLQIFKVEIDAQIVEIQSRRADTFLHAQETGSVGTEITRLTRVVSELQKVITSQGDVPLDPSRDAKMIGLVKQRDSAQKQADKYYNEWQCLLYVGPPKCAQRGPGPLARATETSYKNERQQVDNLNHQIAKRTQELTATSDSSKKIRLEQARKDLPGYQAQLDGLRRQQVDLQTKFSAENRNSGGLLLRLQALKEVSGTDATLNSARLLLFLLFTVIECLPVIVKLMQRPGVYERILAIEEQRQIRAAREQMIRALETTGRTSLEDIWAAREPQEPLGPTVPESESSRPDDPGFEDNLLRGMRDLRGAELPDDQVERHLP